MKTFKNRFFFNLIYLAAWLIYFFAARFCFLIYNFDKTKELTFSTILQTFFQGIKLDISFASYLAVFPFLTIAFSVWVSQKFSKVLIKIFTFSFLILLAFLFVLDLALYGPWSIRIDSTIFLYLKTPKEMFASASFSEAILAFSVLALAIGFGIYFFNWLINRFLKGFEKGNFLQFFCLIFLLFSLILPIRGGFQTVPINQSNVYFSDKMFANHAAINFAWNFAYDLDHAYQLENSFEILDKKEALNISKKVRQKLIQTAEDSIFYPIRKDTKPNVILIIWESLTAKVVEPLGGEKNVTSHFNQLTKEGILFNNFYANGDRSDKGLVAILSGYYPQPDKSIIKMPNKTKSLPMLSKQMKKLGYSNAFYYGGDLNFGNMNTYLRNGAINNFVDGDDFKSSEWNSKWGAHDHILIERFLEDLKQKSPKPFFKTLFTLSSHEPFEFPDEYKFGKKDKTNQFRSAIAYTDKAIGKFIENAKKMPWWKNSIVIIMADHGHHLPKHKGRFNSPKKFHIPMLWLGGALTKTDTIIENICSQKDFAYSLLAMLNGDNSEFEWGHNIFKNSSDHFAHFIFNKGFGILNKNALVIYDYNNQKAISSEGKTAQQLEKTGKAITQSVYQDFIER